MLLTARQDTYKIPAEFTERGETYSIIKGLIRQNSQQVWRQLAILNPDEWEAHRTFPVVMSNWPDSVCLFWNGEIKFFPTPDTVYEVKLHIALVL